MTKFKKIMHFKVSEQMEQQIKKKAANRNLSVSAYIRMILSLHLKSDNNESYSLTSKKLED